MTDAPATRVARIRAALEAALAPTELEVIDDSQAHAGHAGALTGKGHFRVMIVAPCFAASTGWMAATAVVAKTWMRRVACARPAAQV